ncbi:MAG: Crp/Fnr family transcriptional regulator [Ilumatobacteraceae bacterium]
MTHEDLLLRTELFADASLEVLHKITAHALVQNLQRGDVLFDKGDVPDSLFVVISGRIAITVGNKPLDSREGMIALMEAGDLWGELGMLDNGLRSAMARAIEPSSVLRIPYAPILEQIQTTPSMLWGVTKMLAARLRVMDEVFADSVFLDVTGRTAKRLLELSNGEDEFLLPVTQEELAGMVGASRERVNKAIASFIRLGWLEQRDRHYKILMRQRLSVRSS